MSAASLKQLNSFNKALLLLNAFEIIPNSIFEFRKPLQHITHWRKLYIHQSLKPFNIRDSRCKSPFLHQ